MNPNQPFTLSLLSLLALLHVVAPATNCSPEFGGGICPDGDTCCPTGIPGVSSCVPGKEKDPKNAHGQCCDPHGTTGCAYGYQCALKAVGVDGIPGDAAKNYKRQQHICELQEPHPQDLNAKETPRYKLCRLPPSSFTSGTLELQNFPIHGYNAVYYSSMGSILPTNDKHDLERMQKFSSIETVVVIVHGSGRNADDYLCAGISTTHMVSNYNGTECDGTNSNDRHDIHSGNGKILVIAPKFVADIDRDDRTHYPNTLYWLEHGPDVPLGHAWRYGADAANANSAVAANTSSTNESANEKGNKDNGQTGSEDRDNQTGISSYSVMDKLLEFLINSKQQNVGEGSTRRSIQEEVFNFPKLKRIVVAGHSAGGQYVHRWALLSSSPVIWGNDDAGDQYQYEHLNNNTRRVETRVVVANPRSYCYPDNRRMIRTQERLNKEDSFVYSVPDPRDVSACPTYNQWEWGLDPGGDIFCPYKDAALEFVQYNLTVLALRYSKRKVFYLAGEYDTIVQEDRCETYKFQGVHRNERAKRYFRALTEYLTSCCGHGNDSMNHPDFTAINTFEFNHEFHQVPGSPHDHTLMFQSRPGLEAFYGIGNGSSIGGIQTGDHGHKMAVNTNLPNSDLVGRQS